MTTTLACVVEKPLDAQRLVDELVNSCHCDRSDISVIARSAGSTGSVSREDVENVKKALDTNATAARTVIDWMLEGLESATRSIPGGGVIRTFGSLGAKIADAGVSTAAEFAKALVDAGVPKGEAGYYAKAFERGGIVVTVQARTDNIALCARQVMAQHGTLAEEAAPVR